MFRCVFCLLLHLLNPERQLKGGEAVRFRQVIYHMKYLNGVYFSHLFYSPMDIN